MPGGPRAGRPRRASAPVGPGGGSAQPRSHLGLHGPEVSPPIGARDLWGDRLSRRAAAGAAGVRMTRIPSGATSAAMASCWREQGNLPSAVPRRKCWAGWLHPAARPPSPRSRPSPSAVPPPPPPAPGRGRPRWHPATLHVWRARPVARAGLRRTTSRSPQQSGWGGVDLGQVGLVEQGRLDGAALDRRPDPGSSQRPEPAPPRQLAQRGDAGQGDHAAVAREDDAPQRESASSGLDRLPERGGVRSVAGERLGRQGQPSLVATEPSPTWRLPHWPSLERPQAAG